MTKNYQDDCFACPAPLDGAPCVFSGEWDSFWHWRCVLLGRLDKGEGEIACREFGVVGQSSDIATRGLYP